jgi:hypothetical protein
MKHPATIAAILVAAAIVAWSGMCHAAERRAGGGIYANPGNPKTRHHRKRPLEVTIHRYRRIGGYSYGTSDVTSTYGRAPPPYLDVRQSPGGPFDSGFFFDSGISPRGGNSLYFH